MKNNILEFIDFERVDALLEGFNKSTGFVTAILDLDGNVLSKSGWRQICTEFHRIHPETSKKCTISDTVLAGKLAEGEEYHFYQCLNGLVDVAVPIVINGEHIANLFSGQFFFEQPEISIFKEQAKQYGFNEEKYLKALEIVPVVPKEKVKTAMDFLLDMTQLISEMTFQRIEQVELNKINRESDERFSKVFKSSPIAISIASVKDGILIDVNDSWCQLMGFSAEEVIGHTVEELKMYDTETGNKIRDEFLRSGKISLLESDITTKSGEKKHVLNSAEIITIKGNPFSINLVTDITKRKQAEDKLRESELFLQTTINSLPEHICVLDETGRIVITNQAWDDFALANNGDLQCVSEGANYLAVCDSVTEPNLESASSFSNGIRAVLSGESQEFSLEYPCDSATEKRWFLGKVSPLLRNDSRWVVINHENITKRKRAEEALLKSEERFRVAQDVSPDGFTILSPVRDANGRVVDFTWVYENATVARWNGTDPEAVVGKRLLELFPGHAGTQFMQTYQLVAETGVQMVFEEEYRGETIANSTWFRIIVVPTGLDIAILAQNITERKLAEERLRENERHLRSSQQIAHLGSWRLDSATNQVMWTEELYKMYGFDPALPPPPYTEHMKLFAPSSWERLSTSLAKTQETGIPYELELETVKKDGSNGWMWVRGEVTKDSEGNTVGLWGAAQDITERKEAEREIHRLNVELEKRVAERTAELRGLVNAMAGREVRMAELKEVIHRLRDQLEKSGLTPVAGDPLEEL